MIPKIIHQTWKTDQIPSEWQAFAESWKNHHPEWEYRLWTNSDGAEFVRRYYPELRDAYFSYPHDIQRADVIRYLVIHHFGGVYADLDFECLQAFDSLCDTDQLIIGFEPVEHAHQYKKTELLCNALFAAYSNSSFLQRVIDFLIIDKPPSGEHGDVMKTTGPLMLQKVYEQFNHNAVDPQPSFRFYPFIKDAPQLSVLASNSIESHRIREMLVEQGCYAVHHWANSWTGSLAGNLVNPKSDAIDEFDFYPRQSSPGMNLFNGGRDISVLADRCRKDLRVAAFDTNGFVKHTVLESSAMCRMQGADANEGLYVRKRPPFASVLTKVQYEQLIKISDVGQSPFYLFVDDKNDLTISSLIKQDKIWEPVETALLSKLISRGDTVVDIGAHIGYFTMLFSQLVGENGSVYGYEPDINNFSLLQANVLINRSDNVNIENQAISDGEGEAHLYLAPHNKGDHRLSYTPDREKTSVSCNSLDYYFATGSEPIHFIKSDTQGHELQVLVGMTEVIMRNKEHLCCLFEFSPGLLTATSEDGVNNFFAFLDSFGAELYCLREGVRNHQIVFMDKPAIDEITVNLMEHDEPDRSCNLLIFFSENARNNYFKKMGW